MRNIVGLYNASCSASLKGDYRLVFEWLKAAIDRELANIEHLKKDSDLVALHQDRKWAILVARMQAVIAQKEAKYNKPLRGKVLEILREGQEIRSKFIAAQKNYGRESKEADSIAKIAMYKDSINLTKVSTILDEYGWVGADKVGSPPIRHYS